MDVFYIEFQKNTKSESESDSKSVRKSQTVFYIDFQFNTADPPVFQQKGFTIDALRFWIINIRKPLKQLSALFNLSEDLKNALNDIQND